MLFASPQSPLSQPNRVGGVNPLPNKTTQCSKWVQCSFRDVMGCPRKSSLCWNYGDFREERKLIDRPWKRAKMSSLNLTVGVVVEDWGNADAFWGFCGLEEKYKGDRWNWGTEIGGYWINLSERMFVEGFDGGFWRFKGVL